MRACITKTLAKRWVSITKRNAVAASTNQQGGPTLRAIAGLFGPPVAHLTRELVALTKLVTFTVLIGNADAHGKNIVPGEIRATFRASFCRANIPKGRRPVGPPARVTFTKPVSDGLLPRGG